MPAPVSSSTAQFGLAQNMFGLSSKADVDAFSSNASARLASFSTTLQSQLDNQSGTRERSAGIEAPPRAREPERSANREAVREPTREPERVSERSDAERPAEAGDRSGGPDNSGSDASSAGGDDAAAGDKAHRNTAHAGKSGGNAKDDKTGTDATDGTTGLAGAADAGTIAGLPADLAALLPQLAAARVAEGAPKIEVLADDSGAKSLQNSGLMPKTDTSAQGADRGMANPMILLMAREAAASAAIGKTAAGVQAVDGELSVSGPQLSNALNTHQAGEFATLRQQAVATKAATPQLPVNTPVGQDGWAEDVGNRVTWMLGRAESKAELVLTPPNLGKLEVSINLNGDQTTAQFIASSQAARNALEQALPRLREILAQAGINLGEANVSTSGEQQSGRDEGGSDRSRGRDGATIGSVGPAMWLRQHDGMVDTFV